MANKLRVSPTGMLTYEYDVGPDVGFSFHTLREVGQPWVAEFQKKLASRGYTIEQGCELPFHPYVADFVVYDNAHLAANIRYTTADTGPWVVTSDDTHWYVIHRHSLRAKCIGKIGGPRANGRGTNYCDRAKETAIRLNSELLRAERGEVA